MAKILVVGSMNMDIVTQVERHPVPGETIQGNETRFFIGGKGANQAVAASRSGASVAMAGGLGLDSFGADIRKQLTEDGIDLNCVIEKQAMTGIALITIDQSGENNIILSAGANGKYGEDEVDTLDLTGFDVILLQNEIAQAANQRVLDKAAAANIPVFLNPAPIAGFDHTQLSKVSFLILNEVEAEELSGTRIDGISQALKAGKQLLEAGLPHLIITLGSKGSLYLDQAGTEIEMPAFTVDAVDTTAAGDTFIGAFAAKYIAGDTLEESLRYATAASALAVSAAGAQSSIPTEDQVHEFLQRIKPIDQ
ncbi:ribokinase [Paenibacillus radicis (ex Gao et al. 2016)]|uniref:Ribokinase n=1 Tax=Paenibacillus radicis (ex Gao et al. 2016) TaxID=1737354 RepID=A0A917H8L7_9BACL|nr:ribokinase [Paenibacillus radicis (ex Gao et al. 2016)]GGG70683.1 ribokinase [Paenibacillus radicis (ex Gao et al. 2016)]